MMVEPKTTCKACGTAILVATAKATGGYCRSNRCEKNRAAKKRIEGSLESGALQHCPRCGNPVCSSKIEQHLNEKCEMRPRPHPYASVLPPTPIPEWLVRLAKANSLPPFIPIEDVLQDSCFYPASGLDSSPVLLANGCVHSFIFIDYSISRNAFLQAVSFPGFAPYSLILGRDVNIHELVPDGWAAEVPQHFDNPGFNGRERLLDAQKRCNPFGHWSIWHRHETRGEWVGPRLFSFLFIGGEAIASYQGLYLQNRITPKVMAIIQPGHVCGDNWTNFNDPNAPLWETVSQGEKLPEFLLIGSYGETSISEDCPFEGYAFIKRTVTYEDGRTGRVIGIFKKNI